MLTYADVCLTYAVGKRGGDAPEAASPRKQPAARRGTNTTRGEAPSNKASSELVVS